MLKQKIYYFAYGSNLSHVQMHRRCSHAKYVGKAYIKNYRVITTGFSSRWRGGVATIIRARDMIVWGVVYELDAHCLLRLDGFEGVRYKLYKRKVITCYSQNGKKRQVLTYIREPKKIRHSSKRYKRIILKGAHFYGLPKGYIRKLASEL
jgi:gamma-glutamylcyclotransferase (GGCT)/AIG2-like uncharacterized protein YtfP